MFTMQVASCPSGKGPGRTCKIPICAVSAVLIWSRQITFIRCQLMLIELTSASFHVAPLIQWKKGADLVGIQGPGSYRFNVL